MNILIINNIFPPGFVGGYELGAYEIARGLVDSGHKISVLTSDYFQDDTGLLNEFHVERHLECDFVSHRINDNLDGSATNKGFYVNYSNIRRIASAVNRLQPDIILLFNLMGLGPLGILHLIQSTGIPCILYLMDNIFAAVDRGSPVYNRYVSVFGAPRFAPDMRVVAMSRNVIKEVAATLGFAPPNVTYIPGWINKEAVVPQAVCRNAGDEIRFVVCSRIAAHKGVDIVVDAAAELVRSGVRGFSIHVYGAGQVALFLQRVQSKGVGEYIRYMGCKPKDQMLALFQEYDALLFPTWEREPFGFTVVEAAAGACFPIMTAGIGASEWFIDGVDCVKIARASAELVAAMHHAISMDSVARHRMRSEALETARRYLIFSRWLTVIEDLCEEAHAAKRPDAPHSPDSAAAALLFLTQLWFERL